MTAFEGSSAYTIMDGGPIIQSERGGTAYLQGTENNMGGLGLGLANRRETHKPLEIKQ